MPLHVLPPVPLRQWVLTIPHELRRRLAYDGKLFGAVSRLFTDSVLGWCRRRLADEGAPDGRGGAVVVMQRCSADLRLHPHLHGVFLDGVYGMNPEGTPVFRALPRLSTSDVADVLQITRARVLRLLSRRGVVVAARVHPAPAYRERERPAGTRGTGPHRPEAAVLGRHDGRRHGPFVTTRPARRRGATPGHPHRAVRGGSGLRVPLAPARDSCACPGPGGPARTRTAAPRPQAKPTTAHPRACCRAPRATSGKSVDVTPDFCAHRQGARDGAYWRIRVNCHS